MAVTKKLSLVQRLKLARRVFAASGTGFDVTKSSRLNRGFGLAPGIYATADRHLTKYNLGQLRELCRMYDRGSSLFAGLLDRALDNIFGANFDFIPTTGNTELNKKVKEFIAARMQARYADAAGVFDFPEIGKTALRAVWNDGDCLLVKRKNGACLNFEADQIVTPSGDSNSSRRIVLGVELNEFNRPLAYHVRQRKGRGDYGGLDNSAATERVDARYAIMPAFRKRFNQTRGISVLGVILNNFVRTDNYIGYESTAAEINAMMGIKIKKEPAGVDVDLPGVETNTDGATEGTFDKLQKFVAGMIFELSPGEDVDMFGAKRPSDNFESYIVTLLRIIGVGVGMPLELLLLDFSKTNYSSARASLGEARRMFRVWQRFSAAHICMPWYRWQIARAVAFGELPARREVFKARCQWPAWEYIDPFKSARGNEVAIKSRTKSISGCIREMGGEPDEVLAEIAEDKRKLEELGLMPDRGKGKPKKEKDKDRKEQK